MNVLNIIVIIIIIILNANTPLLLNLLLLAEFALSATTASIVITPIRYY